MSPIDDYRRSVRLLRRIFAYCGQNILVDDYNGRSCISYIVAMLWLFWAICFLTTALDSVHYDPPVRFQAAAFIFGSCQVKYAYIHLSR